VDIAETLLNFSSYSRRALFFATFSTRRTHVNLVCPKSNNKRALDSDRPTILRKLNSIENKVDRLLEGVPQSENGNDLSPPQVIA
jgi:hypothetical protein